MAENKEVVVETKPERVEKEVTIELDENNHPVKPVKVEEPKYVTSEQLQQFQKSMAEELKRATAPLGYELRKFKEAQTQPQPVQPVAPHKSQDEVQDEWDTKLQKDWKSTVREMARQEAAELRKIETAQQQAEYQRQQSLNLLENNKRQVLTKHSELNDEGSAKADIYRTILQEKPEYLNNPFGPVLAMRDMEDRLREQGIMDTPTQQIVQKEVARQARTGASVLPKGTSASGNQRITLSKEQKEFCDANGLKYENYGRYMKLQSNQNGVEV
jgi:hypothetical protein